MINKDENKNKKLILLIEDEEIITKLLTQKLEKAGYLVKSYKDGMDGLKSVLELKPDLLLLDMVLPAIDGFGILEKLYKERIIPGLPVIIISNSGQPVEIDRALKLGVRGYLIKVNFDPQEVLQKINNVLSETLRVEKSQPDNFQSVKVLIVEDDLTLIDLLAHRLMREEGYEIFKAIDVERALGILREQKIDVILLDIVLPGVDGFTFLDELKINQEWKEIPVIIMSNLNQEEVEKGLKKGAVDCVLKSNITPQDIVNKVKKWSNHNVHTTI